jgi:hypothetical protein
MLAIDILDYNGRFRLSYTFESESARSVEEYARLSLRWAVEAGLIHKDEANFCRMQVRWQEGAQA